MDNTLATAIRMLAAGTEDASKPATLEFGEVISEEYAPLEIRVHDRLVLDEDFLELTNAVRDHWVDVEVYWETIDDNDLREYQTNEEQNIVTHNANVAIHNANIATYNEHVHFRTPSTKTDLTGLTEQVGEPTQQPVKPWPTSHLHNIAGRKRMRVYNGLHKGEKVVMLRARGGQKYLVLDRITDHITGGEWRTHAGADMLDQVTPPFEPSGLPGWTEGATSESKWPNAAKPAAFVPGAPGPK